MEIRIDPHTLERAEERGTSAEEIKDVIQTGTAIAARYGRMGKVKTYAFKKSATVNIMSKRGWKSLTLSKGML